MTWSKCCRIYFVGSKISLASFESKLFSEARKQHSCLQEAGASTIDWSSHFKRLGELPANATLIARTVMYCVFRVNSDLSKCSTFSPRPWITTPKRPSSSGATTRPAFRFSLWPSLLTSSQKEIPSENPSTEGHWATWKHLDDQLDLLTSVLNLPKSVFILINGPPISSPPRSFWQSRMEKLIRQALDKAMDKDPAAHLFRAQNLRISCESEEISRNPMPFWIAGCLAVRVCLF